MSDSSIINGVEMANIKTISEIEVPQEWAVIYELDFSEADSHDFTSAASTVDLNGVTWSASANDISEETKFQITNGTGLEIDALVSSTNNWYGNERSAPVISALVSDLVSGLGPEDTIAFQLYQTSATLANNWQGNGMGIFDGSGTIAGDTGGANTTASGFVCARNFYEGAVTIGAIRNTSQDKYATTQGDFFEIIWYPTAGCYLAVGTMPAIFKDPGEVYTYQGYVTFSNRGFGSDSAGSPTYGMPDWDIHRPGNSGKQARIGIFATSQYQSSGGAATTTTTATKFRVLRRTT